MNSIDHPIFTQSINYIRSRIDCSNLDHLEKEVLERIIHSTGHFSIQDYLKFSPNACSFGVSALQAGAPILTDTFMAAAAVTPMASRTLGNKVHCILNWEISNEQTHLTRTAFGIKRAWSEFSTKSPEKQATIGLF